MQAWGQDSAGGSSGILEFQAWAADAPPAIDASVAVTSRCVAGSAVLVVTARNADAVPLVFDITTPYGRRSVSAQPGASTSVSVSTRLAALPAGVVTATASGTIDGAAVTLPLSTSFPARTCR